ncbi:MAG: hypothetical protein HMLKMBBP_01676 [Planctomycetes bacterium]|nr:hypothetical protein [Planctomycetota bacterium]
MFWKSRKRTEDARGGDVPTPHRGLPDSDKGSGLCPRCGTVSSFDIAGNLPLTFDGGLSYPGGGGQPTRTFHDRVAVLYCRHCRQGVVVIEEAWVGDYPMRAGRNEVGEIHWNGINWWPLPGDASRPDVPPRIARALGEAMRALHAQCHSSAAVMARRTLEAVTEDKGAPNGTLKQRVDELATRGLLLPALMEMATEVRLIGNVGAHFDPMEEVSAADARALVEFVIELLKYLYELPAELARRKRP